jgi:hypothetical protein
MSDRELGPPAKTAAIVGKTNVAHALWFLAIADVEDQRFRGGDGAQKRTGVRHG